MLLALLLARSPARPNKDVHDHLSETQRASLQKAVELAQRYAANPATPGIWEHLMALVQQVRLCLFARSVGNTALALGTALRVDVHPTN
jgi:hypothetical protein